MRELVLQKIQERQDDAKKDDWDMLGEYGLTMDQVRQMSDEEVLKIYDDVTGFQG